MLLEEGTDAGRALRFKWGKVKPCCCKMVKCAIGFACIGCLLSSLLLDRSSNRLSNKGNFKNVKLLAVVEYGEGLCS